MIISLDASLPGRSSSLPEARGKRAASRSELPPGGNSLLYPCLALLQMGVAWPWYYYQRRWALDPPFHPCRQQARGLLLGRFVSVARSGRFLHPGGYPASCSAECGLSSTGYVTRPRSSLPPRTRLKARVMMQTKHWNSRSVRLTGTRSIARCRAVDCSALALCRALGLAITPDLAEL